MNRAIYTMSESTLINNVDNMKENIFGRRII